jgi:hypothetical protein
VAPSPRDLVARLGLDQSALAQAVYRGGESARYFRRGYRFGKRLPPSTTPLPADPPASLSDLEAYAEAHETGPGIFKWQHYYEIYERHLSRFRGQDVQLVEIGVAGGGSLGMWRDYLGPTARICGIDVDPGCRRFEADGIEIVIGDQGDPAFWGSFLHSHPRIDIVIDDGGHLPEQQAVTLESLLPAIRPGGVYVCEDIHGAFQPFQAYLDGLTRPLSEVGFADQPNPMNPLQLEVASVHRYPILTVIEKASWSPQAFEARRHGTQWPEDWAETGETSRTNDESGSANNGAA